tara:strand:+ start:871 stop:1089 length:219 start_codon:yes stop_codon:yes gene_type:complete
MEKYKLLFVAILEYCSFKKEAQELHEYLTNARHLLCDSEIINQLDNGIIDADLVSHVVGDVEDKVFELLERT